MMREPNAALVVAPTMPQEGDMTDEQPTPDPEEIPDAPEAPSDPQPDEPEAFDAEKAREKIRKVNSEAAALRKRLQDAEARGKDADEKTQKLTALESENLRLKIAVKHGLPESLVKRLSGTTEEEILQDAEELMELFGTRKPPSQQPKEQLRTPGSQVKPAGDVDYQKLTERVFSN